ncbi:MAG: hypothetical protein GC165_04770 [Armatimonadetes bacterium]|nr:hypothetical protein [Armatimonadota bacterium]
MSPRMSFPLRIVAILPVVGFVVGCGSERSDSSSEVWMYVLLVISAGFGVWLSERRKRKADAEEAVRVRHPGEFYQPRKPTGPSTPIPFPAMSELRREVLFAELERFKEGILQGDDRAITTLIDVLEEEEHGDMIARCWFNDAGQFYYPLLIVGISLSNPKSFLASFAQSLNGPDEQFVYALFRATQHKARVAPDLFEEACGLMLRSPRSTIANEFAAMMFRNMGDELLGTQALALRRDLQGLGFSCSEY